jgi:hypothetical protein
VSGASAVVGRITYNYFPNDDDAEERYTEGVSDLATAVAQSFSPPLGEGETRSDEESLAVAEAAFLTGITTLISPDMDMINAAAAEILAGSLLYAALEKAGIGEEAFIDLIDEVQIFIAPDGVEQIDYTIRLRWDKP